MAGSSAPRYKLNPDPIRSSSSTSSKKLSGNGPNHTYRHIHHQRGTIGTFHIRLLEGSDLSRKHWSALSLGPVKHLGLSKCHGEVSSFGTLRLAFWNSDDGEEDGGVVDHDNIVGQSYHLGGNGGDYAGKKKGEEENSYAATSSESSMTSSSSNIPPQKQHAEASFMPSMPPPTCQPRQHNIPGGQSPFDQGCIRSFSPARSPFFSSYENNTQQKQSQQQTQNQQINHQRDWDSKPSAAEAAALNKQLQPLPIPPSSSLSSSSSSSSTTRRNNTSTSFGPPEPHHYAKEEFKSSTVHNDSNPIWGSDQFNLQNSENQSSSSTFHIPLQKDDFLPTLLNDGGKVSLEIRIDEEMTGAESLIVGSALSTVVGTATAATSVVGLGHHTQNVSNMGREMMGLSTDRLIGKGYVDLMPLLLGLWEESWEQGQQHSDETQNQRQDKNGSFLSGKGEEQDSMLLNEYGKINSSARKMKRRMERMGMLDVWVPLYHPTATTKARSTASSKGVEQDDDDKTIKTSGKVHLLISYEPNGMIPKRDDVVAFESFARRPIQQNNNPLGPIITPIVPPLSPLLVVDTRGNYLLLEYSTSRTVTSVDRNGNVKSSKWERTHRVRIHRNAIFVIERHTLMDAAGNIARLPGDIVLSTPIGQEIAEVSAPIVAGAMELMGPALLWGKLMMAAGGTGVRASLAGARAATEAVVSASQEKALERRDQGGNMEYDRGDAGVYSSYRG